MVAPQLRRARVRVPCSTSNLGAGFDALGLAFTRFVKAEFAPGSDRLWVNRNGTCRDIADEDDKVKRAFVRRLAESGVAPVGSLSIESRIPLARGLGSSAAAVV